MTARRGGLLLALLAALAAGQAAAQARGDARTLAQGFRMPQMPQSGDPADLQRMADQMMAEMARKIGVDPEVFANASEAERKRMLKQASRDLKARMTEDMEARTGKSVEEMKTMDRDALAALMTRPRAGGDAAPAPEPPAPDHALAPPPPGGFADGSEPLPVGDDLTATVRVDGPPGRDVLLVVADAEARRIALREDRTAPFTERLDLAPLSPRTAALVVEIIDPETRRVTARYRPVSAAD